MQCFWLQWLLIKSVGSIPQALLFNSSDLVKWTYVTTVWTGNSTIGPRAEYVTEYSAVHIYSL